MPWKTNIWRRLKDEFDWSEFCLRIYDVWSCTAIGEF